MGTPFFFMQRVIGGDAAAVLVRACGTPLRPRRGRWPAIHTVDWRAAGPRLPAAGWRRTARLPSPSRRELAGVARAERMGFGSAPCASRSPSAATCSERARRRAARSHPRRPQPRQLPFPRANEVVAVVDWELAAIGDPRSDFGFYAALLAASAACPARTAVRCCPSLRRRHRHPARNLGYYEAFGLYRMAIVMAGWAGRMGGGGGSTGRPGAGLLADALGSLRRLAGRSARGGQREDERRARPGSLVAQISPPWARTISREIASPRPYPSVRGGAVRAVEAFEQVRDVLAGMPSTGVAARPPAGCRGWTSREVTRTAPPDGVWRKALSSRLFSTCSRRSKSPRMWPAPSG